VVLREAGRRLQSSLRAYDSVGRYGGEEFLVVLPGSANSCAVHLADRLRSVVATEPVVIGNLPVHISISMGVTALPKGGGVSPEMLIRAADEALYRAKRLGRNRVEWTPVAETAEACPSPVA
jgi:diguanylate cyclase (GGDEF)-like protein